jgi:hypothetical protein
MAKRKKCEKNVIAFSDSIYAGAQKSQFMFMTVEIF